MPCLQDLTFKILKVSQGHLQNIARVYTPVSKQQVCISVVKRLGYTTQYNTILAKSLMTMVTQERRRADTIQLRRKDPRRLAPMCERPKAGCESHCSHKFSVQTLQVFHLVGTESNQKLYHWREPDFNALRQTAEGSLEMSTPYCYNGTGFSL